MSLATETEAAREFARNVGRDQPERAWILSPYDAWFPNPFYDGPPVRHPEDDYVDEEFTELELAHLRGEFDDLPF